MNGMSYFFALISILLSGCGPYQKAEMTPSFILLLISVYIVGHFSARLLLSWFEDYTDKLIYNQNHKAYLKELGLTEAEYEKECEELKDQIFNYKVYRLLEMKNSLEKKYKPCKPD